MSRQQGRSHVAVSFLLSGLAVLKDRPIGVINCSIWSYRPALGAELFSPMREGLASSMEFLCTCSLLGRETMLAPTLAEPTRGNVLW